MTARVTCVVDRGIATVHLDNPGRRNAVSYAFFLDLEGIVGTLALADDVHVVVLTGRGDDFCVGADLAAPPGVRTLRGDAGDRSRLLRVNAIASALYRLPQVTIAAVDGACAGGGLALAAATDLRIATERAVFNTAFLAVGLPGDLGAVWFLNRLLGAARTRELFLLPGKLSASRAAEIGLVSRVVGAGDLAAETQAMAARLAAAPPAALRALKANILQAGSDDLDDYLPDEVDRMVESFRSPAAADAAAAFLNKRTPDAPRP